MSAARLWLIRHGQTDWNLAGRIQGQTPTDLNAQGRREARAVADHLVRMPRRFAACYASDLPRALQTAQIIAGQFSLDVRTNEALRERSFGTLEGATTFEVKAARSAAGIAQVGDLADWTGMPGIETNDQLFDRASAALRDISDNHPDADVLVVTHGGVLARLLYRSLGIPDGTPRHFPLSNGIVAVMQHRIDAFYLLTLADLSFLAGKPPSEDTAMAPPAPPAS